MRFHYKRKGEIGIITMVNPPHGAMISPVFAKLTELEDFLGDDNLKAVAIKGEGRHFCSGADPDGFEELFDDAENLKNCLVKARALLEAIRYAPVPVAAIISGSCLGGGLEIALACHFRFAAKSAMFGFPETGHNLIPGMGGTVFSQHQIGRGKLMELVLSGRMIGAEEALQSGLVDHVCPVKKVEEEAFRFLGSLTSQHSQYLVHTVMQSIHNGCRLATEDALVEETRLFCELAGAARSKQK